MRCGFRLVGLLIGGALLAGSVSRPPTRTRSSSGGRMGQARRRKFVIATGALVAASLVYAQPRMHRLAVETAEALSLGLRRQSCSALTK